MRAVLAAVACVVVGACSSSSGGSGTGEAQAASSTAVATTGDASSSATAGEGGTGTTSGAAAPSGTGVGSGAGGEGGSGGDGGAAPTQNAVSLNAWRQLQGRFDSEGQEPEVEGDPVPPPRHAVGCAVDAPVIGERVIYLERWDPASDDPPDRQFVLSFASLADPKDDPFGNRAMATIHRLVDPTEWEGRCEVGTTMALAGPVTAEDGCTLEIVVADFWEMHLWADEPMPAQCVAPYSTAMTVRPHLAEYGPFEWSDVFTNADGSTFDDPGGQPAGVDRWLYQLERR